MHPAYLPTGGPQHPKGDAINGMETNLPIATVVWSFPRILCNLKKYITCFHNGFSFIIQH